MTDPFAGTKLKPLPRGKSLDSFTLSAPQLASGHLWEGTVRSGKTVTSILRWLEFALEGPPGNLAMIGKTERSLKRNVLDVIVAMLGPKRAKIISGAGIMRICGRLVYLAGANNELAVAKIQGLTLVGFYGDEMSTWPKSLFNMATTRLSEPGAEWFGTSNPDSSVHHLKTEVIDRAKLHLRRDGSIVRRRGDDAMDVHVYSFTLYDNPFLTPEFVRKLERSYVGMFRRRYILGEWCMAEGAIYDAWDPDRHTLQRADLPTMDRWIGAGVDYGTTNPFHAVDLAIGPQPFGAAGKALYITTEYRYDVAVHKRSMTNRQYANATIAWLRSVPELADPALLAIDPSAKGFRNELYELGFPSTKADNDVLAGIMDVGSLIAHDRFYVCREGAPELIREVPAYAWSDAAALKGDDEPIKKGDHGLDAKRYIVRTGRGEWYDEIWPEEVSV